LGRSFFVCFLVLDLREKDTEGVKDPKRVEKVIKKVRDLAKEKGIDEDLVESVYRTMITEFIALEMKGFI
jgi:isochorismate pyruvate lyase